jgi:hypothetical protein
MGEREGWWESGIGQSPRPGRLFVDIKLISSPLFYADPIRLNLISICLVTYPLSPIVHRRRLVASPISDLWGFSVLHVTRGESDAMSDVCLSQ